MPPRNDVSVEQLASIIELRDGIMFWKARGQRWFDPRYAGQPVSLRMGTRGYYSVRINRKDIGAHRIIWALHYGSWPVECIDHINGIRTDNRIDNLRDVPVVINNLNTSRSKTGGGGVYWCKTNERWIAQIRRAGRCTRLGSFATRDEALRARRAGELRIYGMALEIGPPAKLSGGGIASEQSGRAVSCHIAHDRSGL